MEKKCNKCNVIRDVSEFYKLKGSKDGLRGICKVCEKQYPKTFDKENRKKYLEANKEKIKQNRNRYYEANKEKIKEKVKQYQEGNKEKVRAYQKQYIEANKEKVKESRKKYIEENKEKLKQNHKQYYEANKKKMKLASNKYNKANKEKIIKYREDNKEKTKRYYEANKEKINNYTVEYIKSRIKTDSLFRLKWSTRANIHRYLRDGKSKRTRDIIGIGFKEFQNYLEVEYTEGMHLDHIVPLSWAINDEEVYILNHYSNFQIITAEENLDKKDRYCKSENLKKVLDNHNDLTKLNQIIERNSDKIK